MHRKGHVVLQDKVAGLGVVEAHVAEVTGDERPHIDLGDEHGGVVAGRRQHHDKDPLDGGRLPVDAGGRYHDLVT